MQETKCDNYCSMWLCNVGVYGDVMRVKILYNKRDSALIQFKEPQHAQTGTVILCNMRLYFGGGVILQYQKHACSLVFACLPSSQDNYCVSATQLLLTSVECLCMGRRSMLPILNMLKYKCRRLEAMYVCVCAMTVVKNCGLYNYMLLQEDALTEDHTNSALHRFKVGYHIE